MRRTPWGKILMPVLWPSFLMAGVLEMLVFAVVDPSSLHGPDGSPTQLSSMTIYTLTFFVFWAVMVVSGLLSHVLARTPRDVNETGAWG